MTVLIYASWDEKLTIGGIKQIVRYTLKPSIPVVKGVLNLIVLLESLKKNV